GGCDFLKCDCEGAEWQIDPDDLAGIRRIEMELHQPPIGGPPNPNLLRSIGELYAFSIDRIPVHGPLGQMGILHAWKQSPPAAPDGCPSPLPRITPPATTPTPPPSN
ncbi:MAG TPA: hypothetical protein PKD31_22460, partial [Blastocatellia bacterium]|nr:hypothetical protein [Blastocatellia bacterium]